MIKLNGIGASPGIAIGRVLVYKKRRLEVRRYNIFNPDEEINKLRSALEKSIREIKGICEESKKKMKDKEISIFEAHLMILEDPTFIGKIEEKIKSEKINAEAAVYDVMESFISKLSKMKNELFRERAVDIRDVGERILKNMMGLEEPYTYIMENVIIVAENLMPSDTAQMSKDKVLAFATEYGGQTSHTAIIARSLGIPAVVGVKDLMKYAKSGDIAIVDGNGIIILNPDDETILHYRKIKREYEECQKKFEEVKWLPAKTVDGKRIIVAANIGALNEIYLALNSGAEGIGLLRTEFLYVNRDTSPTEEEQFKAYKTIVEKMGENTVIIRTLDIGGDKPLPYLRMPREMNPFLGWRGIRISLDEAEFFKTQLRAILRASAYGKIDVMFPMIIDVEEIRMVKVILREIMEDLRLNNIPFNERMEVGIMIETPSAAIMADLLAKEVDFFSIGTNDLTQYTLAVDRTNSKVAKLYNQLSPAILRLIKMTVNAAHSEGKWVGICGELAGNPLAVPILVGLDINELSMAPNFIPKIKNIIRLLNYNEARKIANEVLSLSTAKEVEELIKKSLNFLRPFIF
jgi:phosphotransferase system enzyme I (PtsI)